MMSPAADRASVFQACLDTHRGIFVKVARAFAAAPVDVADLQQEMMLQFWIALPSFAQGAKQSTWVYRVCLNTALTWRRGRDRREQRFDRTADLGRVVVDHASPAETTDQRELLDRLYAAIQALPEFDRALILLSLDGLAYREIAEVTGLTENHVGVALTRARQRLARYMKGVIDELE
jgi:RNA polymerase sigma-70 factor, ECF subfamily